MIRYPSRMVRRRSMFAVSLVVVGLTACASSPPPAPSGGDAAEPGPPEAQVLEEPADLPENVATALMLGAALLESGNVRSALSYYRFAWESAPDEIEIGRRFVDVALGAGRIEDALDALDRIVESAPDATGLAHQRAELLAIAGRTEAGLLAVDALLARDPDDKFARALQIDLLLDADRPADALKAIDALVEESPDDMVWRVRRGDILLELDRPRRAEDAWREVIEIDPESVQAVDRLADLLSGQGRDDDLLSFLHELESQDALGPAQRARLADLLLERGEREEAVEVLLPLAREGELDFRARRIVADLLASLDRHEEAIDILVPLVESTNPSSAEALRTIGELRMEQGDQTAAIDALERAVEMDPTDGDSHVSLLLATTQADPRLLQGTAPADESRLLERRIEAAAQSISDTSKRQNFLMGAVLRRIDQTERAQPYLERAAALDPRDDRVLYDLAIVQESNRDFEGARETLEQLHELDPDDPHLKNFYGYLLADQGWELETAERLIREALEKEPENGAYIDSMGWVLFRLGRYEEALSYLIDAVNQLGDDPIVLEHLAECLAALGRDEEALRTFERARQVAGDSAEHLEDRIREIRERLQEGS